MNIEAHFDEFLLMKDVQIKHGADVQIRKYGKLEPNQKLFND